MGTEIRRVPPDWEHPRDSHGEDLPIYGNDFDSAAMASMSKDTEGLNIALAWAAIEGANYYDRQILELKKKQVALLKQLVARQQAQQQEKLDRIRAKGGRDEE